MNRRVFLRSLGIFATGALVKPELLIPKTIFIPPAPTIVVPSILLPPWTHLATDYYSREALDRFVHMFNVQDVYNLTLNARLDELTLRPIKSEDAV